MVRRGYETTEFWAMVVNIVLNVAATAGLLQVEDVAAWQAVLVPLMVAGFGVVVYVYGRSAVKIAALKEWNK